MTTTRNDPIPMTDAQLDAVPGGLIAVVIITANRPPHIGAGTGHAKPRAYVPTPPKPGVFMARHAIDRPPDPE